MIVFQPQNPEAYEFDVGPVYSNRLFAEKWIKEHQPSWELVELEVDHVCVYLPRHLGGWVYCKICGGSKMV